MIRKHIAWLVLGCCAFSPLANAAILDMNQFALYRPQGSVAALQANYAYLDRQAALSSSVVGLTSFEWNFSQFDTGASSAGLHPANAVPDYVELATGASVFYAGNTGWQTYVFATPYTGFISIFVQGNQNTTAGIQLRNFSDTPLAAPPAIPAVPEPETYALLLAGLGLMAGIARRRGKPPVVAGLR